jgi:hypothetical protein
MNEIRVTPVPAATPPQPQATPRPSGWTGGRITALVIGALLVPSGSALATERTQLGSAGVGWLYSPGLLGKVRIRVTPMNPGRPLFVGIGRSADVDRYLADVKYTVISDFFGEKVEAVGGGTPRSAPGTQHFWVASSTGSGFGTWCGNRPRGRGSSW